MKKDYDPLQYLKIESLLKSKNLFLSSNPHAKPDFEFSNIKTDSRTVAPGDIFIAYKGITSDGHDHIKVAAERGAQLIILEEPSKIPSMCPVSWIQVSCSREAWAWLEAEKFGNPQADPKMCFIGVTGTNGKTSTVWYVKELLKQNKTACLAIGTLGAWLDDEFITTSHTTPDPPALYELISAARKRRIKYCVMEVSSHSIAQKKLVPLRFDACAFTSFSRDHLDFHKSMEEYLQTKLSFFTELAKPDARHIFCDVIRELTVLPKLPSSDVWTYGKKAKAKSQEWKTPNSATVKILSSKITGSDFELIKNDLPLSGSFPFIGDYALENFTAALLIVEKILNKKANPAHWPKLQPVPGRLEFVGDAKQLNWPFVFVDYAHSPDALEKALTVLRPLCKGKLWVLFGCGGDRDKGKRPIMAKVAEKNADLVVITTDNPRSEPPAVIIKEIELGITDKAKLASTELDRALAINYVIKKAAQNDVILLAGKGHENYMIIGKEKMFFDDRIIAKEALNSIV